MYLLVAEIILKINVNIIKLHLAFFLFHIFNRTFIIKPCLTVKLLTAKGFHKTWITYSKLEFKGILLIYPYNKYTNLLSGLGCTASIKFKSQLHYV